MPHFLKAPLFVLTIFVLLPGLDHKSAADNNDAYERLPTLGDPSAATFSSEEERRIGRLILLKARSSLPLIRDVELDEYIRNLGNRILSASPDSHRLDFHFLLSGNSAINASAWPGGLIVINAGLLVFADQENELAAVLAHEIAHVKQRHIARQWSLSKQVAWADVISFVAALAGAAYSSDAALLGAYAGSSLSAQKRLGYSRALESEADHVGMRIMASAGFHPSGMSSFFSKLKSKEIRTGQALEFLRTHPLTEERLAEAINRARAYSQNLQVDSLSFQQAKARALAWLNPAQALGEAEDNGHGLYQKAVALLRMNRATEAAALLSPPERRGDSKALDLAYAQALLASGDPERAVEILRPLKELYSDRESIRYYFAMALERSGQGEPALYQLREVMGKENQGSEIYLLASKIASQTGKAAIGHEYLSDYYAGNGRLERALSQLDIAERQDGRKNPALRARVSVKRKNIKRLIEDIRKL